MNWRPEGWDNSIYVDEWGCLEAYELGADAMLEELRNNYKVSLKVSGLEATGKWVFIPDEEVK